MPSNNSFLHCSPKMLTCNGPSKWKEMGKNSVEKRIKFPYYKIHSTELTKTNNNLPGGKIKSHFDDFSHFYHKEDYRKHFFSTNTSNQRMKHRNNSLAESRALIGRSIKKQMVDAESLEIDLPGKKLLSFTKHSP